MLTTMRSFIYRLCNDELPDFQVPQKWRIAERSLLVLFNITYSTILITSYPSTFIGFGLGDGFPVDMIVGLFETLRQQNPLLFDITLVVLAFHLVFRLQIMIRGQLSFKTNDPRLPPRTLLLYAMANGLNIVFVLSTALLIGLTAYALGYNFSSIFNVIRDLTQWAHETAMRVPTIVELPLIMAFPLVFIIHGFFHYWVHRLCHINRFLWLTLHRFHHMPDVLTNASTTVVITSIPFFLFLLMPKLFLYAVTSKLFFERPLYLEIFLLNLIIFLPDPYAHQTALYKEAIRSKFIRYFSFFATSQGVYHYLHHTREPEIIASNKTNQVNIGGGLFHIWDIVFGTFQPLTKVDEKTPRIGLWDNPKLHHNPIRLLLSGVYQLIYELRHNPGLKSKFYIIFGSVDYKPEHTKDFHRSLKDT